MKRQRQKNGQNCFHLMQLLFVARSYAEEKNYISRTIHGKTRETVDDTWKTCTHSGTSLQADNGGDLRKSYLSTNNHDGKLPNVQPTNNIQEIICTVTYHIP